MLNIFKKEEKNVSPEVCIFIGRSGCGKGTQVELFKNKLEGINSFKTFHIETGAFLRELTKGTSLTGKLTKDIIDNGGIMPEWVMIGLWGDYLIKNFSGKENLVFDGVARRLLEAKAMDGVFNFYNILKYNVVYINVSPKWATDRLLGRGRKDDSLEDIQKRMAWFDSEVMQSIEFFKKSKNCNFVDVNGEQSVEQVHEEIINKVFNK